jgi:hypothetical protein
MRARGHGRLFGAGDDTGGMEEACFNALRERRRVGEDNQIYPRKYVLRV